MHDVLFEQSGASEGRGICIAMPSEFGLDLARYTAEMDDHIYLQRSANTPKAAAAATSARPRRSSSTARCRTSPSACRHCTMRSPPRCPVPI